MVYAVYVVVYTVCAVWRINALWSHRGDSVVVTEKNIIKILSVDHLESRHRGGYARYDAQLYDTTRRVFL